MSGTIRITFVGDVMCKASMFPAYLSKTEKYDFTPLFQRVAPYFEASDFVVANLETPISIDNKGLSTEQYSFCSPYEFAEAVRDSGIDLVSTANNHCLDRGVEGISSTIGSLDSVGLIHTGVFSDPEQRAPLVVDVEGFRIGFMSYTYGTNAFSNGCYLKKDQQWHVNLFQRQELSNPLVRFSFNRCGGMLYRVARKLSSPFLRNARYPVYERRESRTAQRKLLLQDLKSMHALQPDLVVMLMHSGGQYNQKATADTRELVSWLFEEGVDVVVGTHEHVVHEGGIRRRDGKVCAYCLGNFDGVAGVYDAPWDKMAEYSIAWNLYIDVEQTGPEAIISMSFSILKSVPLGEDGCGIQVVPLYDLYTEERDEKARVRLLRDARIIANRFCGSDAREFDILSEYTIAG